MKRCSLWECDHPQESSPPMLGVFVAFGDSRGYSWLLPLGGGQRKVSIS